MSDDNIRIKLSSGYILEATEKACKLTKPDGEVEKTYYAASEDHEGAVANLHSLCKMQQEIGDILVRADAILRYPGLSSNTRRALKDILYHGNEVSTHIMMCADFIDEDYLAKE